MKASHDDVVTPGAQFVYPKSYSELSKKRVDQLRKIHYVFDTICSESYAHGWDRDKIVEDFEKMCMNDDMSGARTLNR